MNSIVHSLNTVPLRKSQCILISGKMGAGKTTLANIMVKKLLEVKYVAKRFSFATKVKDLALQVGWDGQKDIKGRTLLQSIGKISRAYKPNIFAESLFSAISFDERFPFDFVIIDDWRFPNEYEYIIYDIPKLLYDTTTIRINPGFTKFQPNLPALQDISEIALDNFSPIDFEFPNIFTMQDLENYAVGILNDILSFRGE
jgi:hypothetical protein